MITVTEAAQVAPPEVGDDCRLAPRDWQPTARIGWPERAARILVLVNVALAVRYLTWLVAPGRAAAVPLYVLLVGAELYNMVQGFGFWWTVWKLRPPQPLRLCPCETDDCHWFCWSEWENRFSGRTLR